MSTDPAPAATASRAQCPRDHTCPSPVHHDTHRGYKAGCRSTAARRAALDREAARVAGQTPRLIDSTGTARRLQGLHALGHSDASLAGTWLFVDRSRVAALRTGQWPTVTTTTAGWVAALYLELSETPGPSAQVRTRAERAGEVPPEAWDGCDIDDPTATAWTTTRTSTASTEAGAPATLDHRRERRAQRAREIPRLVAAGRSNQQIAWDLGCSVRTVERIRAQTGSPGATPGGEDVPGDGIPGGEQVAG